ncbi:MAG: DUF4345 family protein [Pseudomonadota bacterium]
MTVDMLNVIGALATIAFGAIGWLAPRFTMAKLDLATDGSALGLSEIRAANGALFVGLAVAAISIGQPLAYVMLGFMYAGAAIGRLTSIVFDGSGQMTSWSFLAAEVALATWFISANWYAI